MVKSYMGFHGRTLTIGLLLAMLQFLSVFLSIVIVVFLSFVFVCRILSTRKNAELYVGKELRGRSGKRPLQFRLLFLVSLVSAFTKLAVTVGVINAWKTDPFFHRKSDLFEQFLLGLDYEGLRENVVIRKAAAGSSSIDPFTGLPPLAQGGCIYSVGPDGVDDGYTIMWDPTNGVVSKGDIFIRSLY